MVTLLKAGIRSRDITLLKRVVDILGEKASSQGRAALLTGSGVMIVRNRSHDSSVSGTVVARHAVFFRRSAPEWRQS